MDHPHVSQVPFFLREAAAIEFLYVAVAEAPDHFMLACNVLLKIIQDRKDGTTSQAPDTMSGLIWIKIKSHSLVSKRFMNFPA